jgi:hypothetical protein
MVANGELKRLSFVKDRTAFFYSKAAELYAAGKGYMPGPFNEVLARAESYSVPVVTTLADNGEKALSVFDSRVSQLLRLSGRARPSAVSRRPFPVAMYCSFGFVHFGSSGNTHGGLMEDLLGSRALTSWFKFYSFLVGVYRQGRFRACFETNLIGGLPMLCLIFMRFVRYGSSLVVSPLSGSHGTHIPSWCLQVDGAVSALSKLYGSAHDELSKAVQYQHEYHARNLQVYKDAREV